MKKYKLIYFKACPNRKKAIDLLSSCGLKFETICQEELDPSDPYKNYASPTLLQNNIIIFGSDAKDGGCSLNLPSKDELLKLISD